MNFGACVFWTLCLLAPSLAHSIPKLSSCHLALINSDVSDDRKELYLHFIDRLRAPNGMSRANRAQVMAEIARNAVMREAIKEGDVHATDLLSTLLETHGDADFRRAIRPHLIQLEGWSANFLLSLLDNSNAPDGFSQARDFPWDTFSESPSEMAILALTAFISGDIYSSKIITRKIFSFMGDNLGLSAEEKVNFCRNVTTVFQGLQKVLSPYDTPFVFDFKKTAQDTPIFCGKQCAYYFVVDNESSFYSAGSYHDSKIDSWPDVFSDWRASSRFIYKAGYEDPIK